MARFEDVYWKSVQAAGVTTFEGDETSSTIIRKTKPHATSTGSPVETAGTGAGGASGTTSPNTKTPSSAGKQTAASAAMGAYIDVLSNDMLKHKSLPSSPETLCGKIVADRFRPSAIDEMCDICMTLGDGFVNEAKIAMNADKACPRCFGTGKSGGSACSCTEGFNTRGLSNMPDNDNDDDMGMSKIKTSANECGTCGHDWAKHVAGAGSCECCGEFSQKRKSQVMPNLDMSRAETYGDDADDEEDELEDDEDYDYDPEFDGEEDEGDDDSWGLEAPEYELPDGDDAGTFVNQDEDEEGDEEADETPDGGYFGLGDEDASFESSVTEYFREDPEALKEFIDFVTKRGGKKAAAAAKIALNYTLDGQKIVDGFKVMLTSQEANSLPYLDTNKITISEKITCSDCREPSWLQTVASCKDCNEFKCSSCMESMRDFSGICRRCANTIDGTIGDDTPYSEHDAYFEYFLNSETESPLFLPEGE